jgi:hypothetical protein
MLLRFLRALSTLFCLLSTAVTIDCATASLQWEQSSAPIGPWRTLACSADGNTLIAAGAEYLDFDSWRTSSIFISTNRGLAWSKTAAPSNTWISVACSVDARTIVAASHQQYPSDAFAEHVYLSRDAGVSWQVSSAPAANWSSVACSWDAKQIVAAAVNGGIYISQDGGVTWTRTAAEDRSWSSITCSADGERLFAFCEANLAAYPYPGRVILGNIFRSLDAGSTWTEIGRFNTNQWSGIACSADGAKLVALDAAELSIYTSQDIGAAWKKCDTHALEFWRSVASSADGSTLVAASAASDLGLLLSYDSGVTWLPTRQDDDWLSVVISADASLFLGARVEGDILSAGGLVSTDSGTDGHQPHLFVRGDFDQISISWVIPSSGYRLQQKAALETNTWNDLTGAPTLDPSTLRYEYHISAHTTATFFRLTNRNSTE